MKNIVISDIMTRDAITVSPDTGLLECAKKMIQKNVGSLLVTENKELKGILTQRDILWVLTKKSREDMANIKASEISRRKLITISPDASVDDVLNKMKQYKLERVPVVKNKELVGIVTVRDILTFNPGIYPEFEEFSRIREEAEKLERVQGKAKVLEANCEECGNYALLQKIDGRLICPSCMDSM